MNRMFRLLALSLGVLMTIGACNSKGSSTQPPPTAPTPPGGGGNPPQTSTATIRVIAGDTGAPLNANVRAGGIMKSEAGSTVTFDNLDRMTEVDADAPGYLKMETRYYDQNGITLRLIPAADAQLWDSIVFDNIGSPRMFVKSGSSVCLALPPEFANDPVTAQSIAAGAQLAQDAMSGLVSVGIGSSCDVPVTVRVNTVNQGVQIPTRDEYGRGHVIGGKIELTVSGARNHLVVAHEIIHVILAGGHLKSGQGLMTLGTGDMRSPTEAEKRIFRYAMSGRTEVRPVHNERQDRS